MQLSRLMTFTVIDPLVWEATGVSTACKSRSYVNDLQIHRPKLAWLVEISFTKSEGCRKIKIKLQKSNLCKSKSKVRIQNPNSGWTWDFRLSLAKTWLGTTTTTTTTTTKKKKKKEQQGTTRNSKEQQGTTRNNKEQQGTTRDNKEQQEATNVSMFPCLHPHQSKIPSLRCIFFRYLVVLRPFPVPMASDIEV